jgi:predicted pyridoxine 5'-phosphate oxidase superfamily flavin-nucleotide-binding protein
MATLTREHQLHRDIERTRAQLGDTVEALVHKVNVPARIKDKVHDTQQTVQTKAEKAIQHLLDETNALPKAGQIAVQARHLLSQALEKLPPPLTARLEPLMAKAQQRPVLATVVTLGALVVLPRLLRRNR